MAIRRTIVFVAVLAAVFTASNATASPGAWRCPSQVRTLNNALTNIEGHVEAGVGLAQYRALVASANVAYYRVPWPVSFGCKSNVARHSKRALNDYRGALTLWSGWCGWLRAVGTSSCALPGTEEGAYVRRSWRDASTYLSRATRALG
jgi:hypothetical protein